MTMEEELLRHIAHRQFVAMEELSGSERKSAEILEAMGLVYFDLAVFLTEKGRNAIVHVN